MEILERQIEEEFLRKLYAFDIQDEYYDAKSNSLKSRKNNTKKNP